LLNKSINREITPSKGTREKRHKSKQKIIFESAECTMENPKSRKHET
jgi:hypothetical protein